MADAEEPAFYKDHGEALEHAEPLDWTDPKGVRVAIAVEGGGYLRFHGQIYFKAELLPSGELNCGRFMFFRRMEISTDVFGKSREVKKKELPEGLEWYPRPRRKPIS